VNGARGVATCLANGAVGRRGPEGCEFGRSSALSIRGGIRLVGRPAEISAWGQDTHRTGEGKVQRTVLGEQGKGRARI
jgi:hypothetical protein